MKTRLRAGSKAVAVLALGLALAGCGSEGVPGEGPSTIYPESSPTGTLPALKAFLEDADGVLRQIATTIGALPDSVQGMNKAADETWTSAAAQLDSVATQLGDEAAALEALDPPAALQPVQSAVVRGIRAAQTAIEKLAARIESGAGSAAMRRDEVRSQVDHVKARLEGLTRQLRNAIGGVTGQ